MENNEVVNAQPELPGIIDGSKSYMYEQLWKLCAGSLFDLPKLDDTVYYFPQGQIELVETSTGEVLNHVQPVFDLPSKLRCRVTGIELKAQKDTEEVFAMISLMPDTSEVIIPTHNGNHQTLQVNSFTKILTASDTSTHGGFSVPRKHANECLPPLDASQPVPQQELFTTDLHGNIWKFKHSFRGTPRRHLFTTGWSAFATAKKLVAGDVFIFLRGENGELRVGIRRAGDQEGNIPSSLISTEIMRHGVIADAMHAFNNKSKFVVVYKPRLSQCVVSYDKFLDSMNKKFEVGSRFSMLFEGDDFCERRYYGIIIGVNNFSPHWKDSEWRSLQVQWDEVASFPRSDRVSPWEIEHLSPSSNILQSTLLKNKRPRPINEIGSSSSQTLWLPTLTQGQEIGQSSIVSPISVPQLNYPDGIEDAKTPSSLINYSVQTMPKVNYNNDHVVTPIKEKITTDAAGASVRLFGVPLTAPSEIIKDPMEPVNSYQKSEISKLPQKKKLGTTHTLTSPKEIQSKQFSSTRSCTKVHMQGVPIGRALDLSVLNGYDQLTKELDKLFDLKGQLQTRNQWEIVFIDNEGDKMLAGDDPWSEFCNMVKKIIICSKEEVKNLKSGNSLSN